MLTMARLTMAGLTMAGLSVARLTMARLTMAMWLPRSDPFSLWLQARLGLSDDELRHLATRLPQLLGLSVSANIEPKLSFLQQQLELDEAALRHEVLRAPTVLGSSLADSLRPNAEMWQAELRAEGLDLGAEIARRGLLFLCFSHQRRTKPRLERLLRAGLPASLALPKMQLTEAKWEQWCRYKGA